MNRNNFEESSSSFGLGHGFGLIKHATKEWSTLHYAGLVIVFLVVFLVVLYLMNADFKNYVNKFTEGFRSTSTEKEGPSKEEVAKALDSLDVLFFYKDSCPYCIQMKDVLMKEDMMKYITPIDTTSEDGKKLVEQYNMKEGVPAFYSLKNGTKSLGLRDETYLIVSELMARPSEGQDGPTSMKEFVDGLDIIVFKTSGCGFCKKAMEQLNELNQEHGINVQVVDLETNEGQKIFEETRLPHTGVPIYYSRKTKNSSVGFGPFEKTLEKLQKGSK